MGFGMSFFRRIVLLFSIIFFVTAVHSEERKLTAYFFNDSVNGFQFSDAYETHNMGLKLQIEKKFYQIDLGIVTPDMFEYENRFRTANRSFGELVSLSYGQGIYQNELLKIDGYAKLTSQGKFGISEFQSIIHKIANFQDDIDLLEQVRMPTKTWVGLGFDTTLMKKSEDQIFQLGIASYFGTDRGSISPYLKMGKQTEVWKPFGRFGVDLVGYDEIVTASPVNAELRGFRPYASFGLSRRFGPLEIVVSENLSLPSISSDNRLYARLYMSAQMDIGDILNLFD